MEKTIKISELARISIKPGEVLVIKKSADLDMGTLDVVANELGCIIAVVDSFDDMRVISRTDLKDV